MRKMISLSLSALVITAAWAAASLETGAKAPEIAVNEWLRGDAVSLEKGAGKNVYLVEFWATWCPHCVESLPELSKLQKKYKDEGLVVAGITDESPETVNAFLKKQGKKVDIRIGLDSEQKTYGRFFKGGESVSIPSVFLIGRDGKILWKGHPADEEMKRQIEKAVQKPSEGSSASADSPKAKPEGSGNTRYRVREGS